MHTKTQLSTRQKRKGKAALITILQNTIQSKCQNNTNMINTGDPGLVQFRQVGAHPQPLMPVLPNCYSNLNSIFQQHRGETVLSQKFDQIFGTILRAHQHSLVTNTVLSCIKFLNTVFVMKSLFLRDTFGTVCLWKS